MLLLYKNYIIIVRKGGYMELKNYHDLIDNDTIVVGCSAGPDSMCLLHLLKEKTNYNIICCHINHNVRKQSIEEE